MGILQRLFGRESAVEVEMWKGIVLEISRAQVTGRDTAPLESVVDLLARSTASQRQRFYLELTFGGFDQDPRPIDHIEQIVDWAKVAEERHPDLVFWLTPGALLRHWLCLGKEYAVRTPDGAVVLVTATRPLLGQAAASAMRAYSRLESAGMLPDGILGVVAAERHRALAARG